MYLVYALLARRMNAGCPDKVGRLWLTGKVWGLLRVEGHMRLWVRLLEGWQSTNVVYVAVCEHHKPQMTTSNLLLETLDQKFCIFFPRRPGIYQQIVRPEL